MGEWISRNVLSLSVGNSTRLCQVSHLIGTVHHWYRMAAVTIYHTHIHTHMHTRACTHIHAHTYMHTYTHTCIHAHAHTYMHTHTCTHTHTHAYTRMHTHTCTHSLQPCMHSYCAGCYSDWMIHSNTCPCVSAIKNTQHLQ